MPEAPAQVHAKQPQERQLSSVSPVESVNGELVDKRQSHVSNKIAEQVKELGLTHPGQIPRSAPHVDLAMQQGIDRRAAEIGRTDRSEPSSYKEDTELSEFARVLSDFGDYADQAVTGRTHRITNINKFSEEREKMLNERLKHKNSPPKNPGVISKVGNWFLKEKKAA